jgi:hypothetical protein
VAGENRPELGPPWPGEGVIPKARRLRYVVAGIVVMAIVAWFTARRSSVDEFSPHSLKFRSRSDLTVMGIPVLSFSGPGWDDEVLTFLVEEGFVSPDPGRRWEPMFSLVHDPRIRQQSRRRNQYYQLFVENKSSTIAWSRNHRECAQLYWGEAIALLRSPEKGDNAAGQFILWECQDIVNPAEMRTKIDEYKDVFHDYPG